MEMDFEDGTFYDSDSTSEKNDLFSSDDNCEIIDHTKEKPASCHFKILMTEQIVQEMTECINDVNGIVNLPRTTIRKLLNHFKWDKEALLENHFDVNEEIFFGQAKITNPCNKPKQIITTPSVDNSGMVECEVCYTFYPPDIMSGLECCHRFCTQCWNDYLTMKIMNGHAQFIECPAYKCDILIDDVAVLKLIADPRVKVNYEHLITNNFVECNKFLQWCPSAGCTYAIEVSFFEDTLPVVCKCSHRFCFACAENWHDPVKCQELKKWLKKCNDDSETSNWIVANTKECPKCGTNIEKNGGCNHMKCNKENCEIDFCWVCMGAWDISHKCNQFDMAALQGIKNDQTKAKLILKRYLHYYNRYMNHMQSLTFEKKLYTLVEQKMEQMRSKHVWNKGQFLTSAVDILCKCRQTLMYTYPFAFYLKKNNHSLMFEDNQNDLEAATETLSGYLEHQLTTDDFADFAQKVQDKYRYCEKRRKILLGHVHEGYEKEFWDIEV